MQKIGDSDQQWVSMPCQLCNRELKFEVKLYASGMFHPRFLVCAACASSSNEDTWDKTINQIICNSPDCERCVELRSRVF